MERKPPRGTAPRNVILSQVAPAIHHGSRFNVATVASALSNPMSLSFVALEACLSLSVSAICPVSPLSNEFTKNKGSFDACPAFFFLEGWVSSL